MTHGKPSYGMSHACARTVLVGALPNKNGKARTERTLPYIEQALARERELQWQVQDVNDAEAELKDTASMVVKRTRARHTRGNFLMNAQLAQKWSNTGQQRQPTPTEEPQGHDEKDDARILAPLGFGGAIHD